MKEFILLWLFLDENGRVVTNATHPYDDVRVYVIKVLTKLMTYAVCHVVWKLAFPVPISYQCVVHLNKNINLKVYELNYMPPYLQTFIQARADPGDLRGLAVT